MLGLIWMSVVQEFFCSLFFICILRFFLSSRLIHPNLSRRLFSSYPLTILVIVCGWFLILFYHDLTSYHVVWSENLLRTRGFLQLMLAAGLGTTPIGLIEGCLWRLWPQPGCDITFTVGDQRERCSSFSF